MFKKAVKYEAICLSRYIATDTDAIHCPASMLLLAMFKRQDFFVISFIGYRGRAGLQHFNPTTVWLIVLYSLSCINAAIQSFSSTFLPRTQKYLTFTLGNSKLDYFLITVWANNIFHYHNFEGSNS